ncbi:GNAT family N-acetyltransferase [Arthrobacter sp. B2a2-09]|uniref:GNAT family N-acetyltransferase n=1 Tax=Arthrobacter sp. B2a2-09 TaxID=2952822 RepID=UPI0022CD7E90|nr:GNAT family N-acetyltransferase [Arthrobacter sp. B2a2-09]MCZ9881134.1 GNAT family N-acetyltransferase [Arthrobacter sp. B2a2-09]
MTTIKVVKAKDLQLSEVLELYRAGHPRSAVASRRGIGRALAERALEQYRHVRQKVLITDDEPRQKAFYEALGYTQTEEFQGGLVRAFIAGSVVGEASVIP